MKNIYFAIKIFLVSFAVLIIVLFIVFMSLENASIESKVDDLKASEKMFATQIGEYIKNSYKTGVKDLKYLSDTYYFNDAKIKTKWETILNSETKYKSIRLIDEYGKNVMSVSKTKDIQEIDISEEEYFIDSALLDDNEIYVSEVILKSENQSDGQFATIFISPVDYNGKRKWIVLEYDAQSMYNSIAQKTDNTLGSVYAISDVGYWNSEENKYEAITSDYFKIAYDIGIFPPQKWDEIKNANHSFGDCGLYTFEEVEYFDWDGEFGVKGVKVKDNNLKVVTLVRAENEYKYYFESEATAKVFRILEEKYGYFIAAVLISVLIVVLLLTNKNNIDQMRNYSHYDPLTKVYNRRQGFILLEDQIANIKRLKKICLCFIDINGLKEVNDTLGHSYGDELILTVTDTINQTIRESDIIIRMGGDEFLIVLSKVEKAIAETIWTRITELFGNINAMDNRKYLISVSHGIVEVSNSDQNIDLNEIITNADDKMYKEKVRIKKSIKIIRNNV